MTTYSYDALGREVSQKQNDKEIISKKYDAVSNVVEKTEKGLTTQYRYDALKHPVQYLYPSLEDGSMKAIVSVDYDEEGNAVQYKDIYDHVIKREYDANSNMIAETNSNGFITRYQYDSLNNMTKVQSPLERVMKYDYDGNNNLVERSYNDKKATYEYDEADNLIKEVSEYGLTETYQYDDFGQMTSYTKNDGTTIDYSYDALGRKLSEGTRQFKYDAYDNLLEADYNNKSVKYTYDKFNNITKVKDANDNNVEYKWDIYGNRTEIKYNDYTIGYTYNQFDKIDKVSKNGKKYASYSYDVRGNTKSLERNGITTDYSYDELNRRTAYVNTKGDKTLSEYKYEYDGQDNVISETINGVVNSYDYNESDELKASTKTIDGKTVITEYSYDLFGNKVESSSDGTNKIYRYNDKNQLTSIKSKDGLTDIYYDKNGNVRDIYYAGGYKEYYQYDEFGQLTTLKTNRDRTYNYEYDGEGDRIHEEKIINSPYDLDYKQDTEEWFDYMQSLPFAEVEELLDAKKSDESFDAMRYQLTYRRKNGLCASNLIKDPKSNEKCEYKDYLLDKTAENTLVLSENDDVHIYGEERISTENADGTQTYLSGNNQSVMAEISSKGTMSQIEYDDFGKTDDKTSGYGYDGEKLDTTGNIYLRARYYNPRIGQFVQIDDYKGTQDNITSQNRYTYCLNNQYKYVDPSGHKSILSIIASAANSVINAVGSIFSNKKDEKKKTVKKPTTVPSKTTGAIASAVSNAVKIVNESTKAVKKVVQPVKKVKAKEPQPCPSPKSDKILDQLQFIIDVIGFLPVAGDVCDAVNALIYFARGMIISAIISIGCIVFTMVADSLLKPLKWAAGKATDLAKRILEKLPDFPKRTISYLKKVPGKIKQIPLVNKCYSTVSSLCSRLSSYIDDLFGRVSTKVAEEWSLPAKLRGTIIEEKLAKIQYAAYEHVGKLADGFFPVFDFFKNGEGISVKTIDVTLPSYEKDSAILRKVKQYASDLNDDVILRKVNNFKKGQELGDKLDAVRKVSTKRLDIYIPKGSLS